MVYIITLSVIAIIIAAAIAFFIYFFVRMLYNWSIIQKCLDRIWEESKKRNTKIIACSEKGEIANCILKEDIKKKSDLLRFIISVTQDTDIPANVPLFKKLITKPRTHYARSKRNKPLESNIQNILPIDAIMQEYEKISRYEINDGDKAIAKVGNTEWYLQNKARTKFHEDKKLPGVELKLIHIDGREAVYNSEHGLLITQDDIMGTYNYFNGNGVPSWIKRPNKGNDVLHGLYDVIPYILWGNTRKDAKHSTTFERLSKIL